jgi:hypothetical protein
MSLIEYDDPLANIGNHGEIMGNQEIADARCAVKVEQQLDQPCLNGDVERRKGFVQNEQFGLRRERAGDADALALAGAQFMGMAVKQLPGKRDAVEKPYEAGLPCGRAFAGKPVVQRFLQDVPDGPARIEARSGVLEYGLQAAARPTPHRPVGQRLALPERVAAVRLLQPEDEFGDRALARTGLADQPDDFRPADAKRYLRQDLMVLVSFGESFDREHRHAACTGRSRRPGMAVRSSRV